MLRLPTSVTTLRTLSRWSSHCLRQGGTAVEPLVILLSRISLAAGDDEATATEHPWSTTAYCRMMTSANSLRGFSTAVRTKTKKATKAPLPVPPNLKVDPRSSFAPYADTKTQAEQAKKPRQETKTVEDTAAVAPAPAAGQSGVVHDDEEEDMDVFAQDEDDEDEAERWFQRPQLVTAIPLPGRLNVPVYHFGQPPAARSGKEQVGTLWLDASVFGMDPIRIDLLKRAVDYHRNKKRGRRKAKTKKIGDMRGSGRKLRRQKGQGKARVGHRFAAHFRGGAKAHGPKNETNYGNTKLNKKVRTMAVRHVLSQKLKEGNLIVVNQLYDLPTHKTKELVQWLRPFGLAPNRKRTSTTGMFLDNYWPPRTDDTDENDEDNARATSYKGVPMNMHVAARNVYNVSLGNQLHGANVYDILNHDKLVLTVAAVQGLEARLKQK